MRVVIVGGTTGIGLETASLLAGSGAEVVITGRSPERVEQALKQLGDRASGEAVDACDSAAMRAFFARIGEIDHVVITVTGRGGAGPLRTLTADAIAQAAAGKLIPHLLTAQAALDVLAPTGSITFVTAASAGAALPGVAALAAINGGIESAVPGLAVELAPLRVNAVSPGVIDTEWWSVLDEETRAAVFESSAARATVGRVGTAHDVASTIAFLVNNSFVTGTVLTVDGGGRLKA
ncbi:SDR family oxidoreductase [Nonomuraea sp. NPDC000554]|uniref:SDR family oxidoreductase n=1 Tax=Nonomuraea sp. NPDC000554 TaxID=3154259 RepID=UPI00332DDB3B